MNRTFKLGTMVWLAMAIYPAWVHAGVMLWQITGMEGVKSNYVIARASGWRSMSNDRADAESVWGMGPGSSILGTATAVMRWELWCGLQAKTDAKLESVPSYLDLISSGLISVNSIEMPEMLGNVER